ncbi:GATA-type domain-containing protein [Mycena chlorophos]|uniref:GATA-type domain-containing protein n=1 Tax=Mycena chlorophos TaxID=658473 RepID=A0A8H6S2A0_MYCCL|nr:GATA-type domain-containing protein [Mycena chlorophos]
MFRIPADASPTHPETVLYTLPVAEVNDPGGSSSDTGHGGHWSWTTNMNPAVYASLGFVAPELEMQPPVSPSRPNGVAMDRTLPPLPAPLHSMEDDTHSTGSCPSCSNPAPLSWRWGVVTMQAVCNACGQYEARKKMRRPQELETKKMLRRLAGAKR